MSLQAAMAFIARCEIDPELRAGLEELRSSAADLDEIAALGRRFGFAFSSEELRTAHEKDWHMRRAFYAGRSSELREVR